ncbi:MAG: urease accessory protein UreE [Cyanobacteria bacterium P01_D01_bin.156]
MYVFTQKKSSALAPTLTLALTAEERTRSRYRYRFSDEITDNNLILSAAGSRSKLSQSSCDLYIEMPRGSVLQHGDRLSGEGHQQILQIVAKPEAVLTVRARDQLSLTSLQLMRAAYHLGNRHVALEVGPDYLRLAPDPVLESMLHQLGVTVTAETMPFQPESGAYGHHH